MLPLSLLEGLPLTPSALLRLGNVPLALMAWILGTPHVPGGGLDFPLSAELVSSVANPSYLKSEHPFAHLNPKCLELVQARPKWEGRMVELATDIPSATRQLNEAEFAQLEPLVNHTAEISEFTSHASFACLFSLGYVPPTIPIGRAYGRVYSVLGNPLLADVSQAVWGGKIFLKTQCNSTAYVHVSVNHIMNAASVWAEIYTASIPRDIPADSHLFRSGWWDGRDSIWIDYTTNWARRCPTALPDGYDWPVGRQLVLPGTQSALTLPAVTGDILRPELVSFEMFENAWPFRRIRDSIRWIGRDQLGNDIFLGRARMDFGEEGMKTIAWFNLKVQRLHEPPPDT